MKPKEIEDWLQTEESLSVGFKKEGEGNCSVCIRNFDIL